MLTNVELAELLQGTEEPAVFGNGSTCLFIGAYSVPYFFTHRDFVY